MNQICDHFYRAIVLCTGESNVKARLADAWVMHLDKIRLNQLPEVIHTQFAGLREIMYSVNAMPGEHPARAAVRKMSTKDAAGHAKTLLILYRQLLDHSQATSLPGKHQDADETAHLDAAENPQRLN